MHRATALSDGLIDKLRVKMEELEQHARETDDVLARMRIRSDVQSDELIKLRRLIDELHRESLQLKRLMREMDEERKTS